jgi:hypothetical protein
VDVGQEAEGRIPRFFLGIFGPRNGTLAYLYLGWNGPSPCGRHRCAISCRKHELKWLTFDIIEVTVMTGRGPNS